MAKTFKVAKVAGWVYIDDDDKVVEVARPADAPEGATVFRLKSMPMDSALYMGLAANTKERTEAIALGVRGAIAEVKGLVDDDGNELVFHPDMIDALPVEALLTLGMHVMDKLKDKAKDQGARRGNEPSGTSRGRRRSGGTPTAESRTASAATN